MTNNIVLLTGGTGFIGFRTLCALLEYNYKVRIVVRSEAKAKTLSENAALKAMGRASHYTFVTIPDFSTPNAFDEAMKGVDRVIHCAAPVPFEEIPHEKLKSHFVDAAVNGTLAVLEAAQKSATVKRVVLLSSGIVLADMQYLMGMAKPPDDYYLYSELRAPDIPEPYAHPLIAYAQSKIESQRRAESWMAERKPGFDLVSLFPAYVIGRDELATSTADLMKSSNSMILRLATGATQPGPAEFCGFTHVDDISLMQVIALDKAKVSGNQGYLFCTNETYAECSEIIAKEFPEEIKSGLLPNTGTVESQQVKIDVERESHTFRDIKFHGIESMVRDTVQQYVELAKAEKAT